MQYRLLTSGGATSGRVDHSFGLGLPRAGDSSRACDVRYHSDMNSESQPLPAAIADRLKHIPDDVVNEIVIWRDRALRAEKRAEHLEGRLEARRVELLRARDVISSMEQSFNDIQHVAEQALVKSLTTPYPDHEDF